LRLALPPTDLIERLHKRIDETGAEVAVAKTGDQPHPVFSLVRRGVLDHLADFLRNGGRKIDALVRDAQRRGSQLRRRAGSLRQYQHARRAAHLGERAARLNLFGRQGRLSLNPNQGMLLKTSF